MKRLLIDINSIIPYYVCGKVNGIGRTTLELIQAIARQGTLPFEISLYSQNMKGIGGKNTGLSFKNKHLYFPHRPKYNQWLSQLPIKEWYTKYDIIHIPHNFEYVRNPKNSIITIHDAMFFSCPEDFLGHTFARKNYPKLAQNAKAILTCSESSKKDIIKYMGVDEQKIFVTPWGVKTELFRPIKDMVHNQYTNQPFFISVSCDIGRKNTISILKAYEKLIINNPSHDLILVWRNPPQEIYSKYTSGIFKNKVHFISNITDNELALLYASATATFFPSKYEGFGLPILESMSCGTPVVTSRNSSLAEVGGEAALYVDSDDIDGICKYMEQFEEKSIDRSLLVHKSIEQAKKFTWESCAKKTIEVYKRCLEL